MFNKNKQIDSIESTQLTNQDTLKFYTLLQYYSPAAPNIAVLGDKEKFDLLVSKYKKDYNPEAGHQMLIINPNKIIFIFNDYEITLVLIENFNDLYKYRLKFKKYL